MSNVFEFVAEKRTGSGKSAAKAVRRSGRVPAVIYGGKSEPVMLTLEHNEVLKHLEHEAVYSHILNVNVDGNKEQALLKGVQRDPARPRVLHLDFMRIVAGQEIKTNVPFHFLNEETCVGVKAGGVVMHGMTDVEIVCLPRNLPEYIEVDLAGLDIGDVIHLSEIKLPEGVEVPELSQGEEHDQAVAQVVKARAQVEEDEDAEVSVAEGSEGGEDSDTE
jgi:large subunit ribosomal protein L25